MGKPNLVDEISGLKQSIDVLRESLDEVYLVLDHLSRNRDDNRYAVYNLVMPQQSPQTSVPPSEDPKPCEECLRRRQHEGRLFDL